MSQFDLTPVEHELMEILWSIKEGSVHDVLAQLPPDRQLAYTSVSTILRILQQKKIVNAIKLGRQHIYQPICSKEWFAKHSVNKMVSKVFSNKPADLVAYLVKQPLTLEEIQTIEALIAAKKQELTK